MGDIEREMGWNYEAAGIDWEERAHLAAAVAGKNAIRAQDAEAEVESLRSQLKGAVEALRAIAEPRFDAERPWLSTIAREALQAMGVPLASELGGGSHG